MRCQRLWAFFVLLIWPVSVLATLPMYYHNSGHAKDFQVHDLPGLSKIPKFQRPLMFAGPIQLSANDTSKIFFWLFQRNPVQQKNLIIWFNSGLGCSSLDGALNEIGPFRIDSNGDIFYNNGTWLEDADLLFIDQPKGTGFSTNNGTYSTNFDSAVSQFLTFYSKFLDLFPGYIYKDIYFAGEGYAAQFIPYFAQSIVENNNYIKYLKAQFFLVNTLKIDPVNSLQQLLLHAPNALATNMALNKTINLAGLIMGSPWLHPNMQSLSTLTFAMDKELVTKENDQYMTLYYIYSACQMAIQQAALNQTVQTFSDPICTDSLIALFLNATKNSSITTDANSRSVNSNDSANYTCFNVYDYTLRSPFPSCGLEWPNIDRTTNFLNRPEVLKSLNVPQENNNRSNSINSTTTTQRWQQCSTEVATHFTNYNTTPSLFQLPGLLANVPVYLYGGDHDLITNFPGLENLTNQIQFTNAIATNTTSNTTFNPTTVQTGWSNNTTYKNLIFGTEIIGQLKSEFNLTLIQLYNTSHHPSHDDAYKTRAVINYVLGNADKKKATLKEEENKGVVKVPGLEIRYSLRKVDLPFVVLLSVGMVISSVVVVGSRFLF